MKRAILADTGPLYAAVDPDDAHHGRARLELTRLARERHEVVVAYSTLLEAYSLVLGRLGRPTATRWLKEMLAGVSLINAMPEDYRSAASTLIARADQPISYYDATLAVLATRLGMEVWTYDRHFDQLRVPVWR